MCRHPFLSMLHYDSKYIGDKFLDVGLYARGIVELFLNRAELSLNSVNSGNLIKQFKVSVSYMCLAGAVVASWSLTQEVAGWQVQALLL